jgi:hypothetical protein
VVDQKDCMVDGQRPKSCVRDRWPMNCCMKHHHARDRHDCSDVPFGNAIVVVGTNACEPHDLSKRRQVFGELDGSENLGVICQVFLRHDSVWATGKFKLLLCFEGLVRVEIYLKLDVNETRGVVHKDTSSRVHLVSFGLAGGSEKPSSRAANEVVNGNSMSGNNVVGLEDVRSVANDS